MLGLGLGKRSAVGGIIKNLTASFGGQADAGFLQQMDKLWEQRKDFEVWVPLADTIDREYIYIKKFNRQAALDDPPPKPDPCGMFFFTLILNACFAKNFFFLSKYNTFVIVFDFLLILFLNLPEKLIWSLIPVVTFIEIISYKLQNVINDFMLWYPLFNFLKTLRDKLILQNDLILNLLT